MTDENKIEAQISYLKNHSLLIDDYLTFYKSILTLQQQWKADFTVAERELMAVSAGWRERLKSGLPLFDTNTISNEDTGVHVWFAELLSLMARYPDQFNVDDLNHIQEAIEASGSEGVQIVRAFISRDNAAFAGLANTMQVSTELLAYLGKTVVTPLLEAYAAFFSSQLAEANTVWSKPICPFCGNDPAMARLEKETGQRYLWCSTCHTQWQFTRMQCPFCLTKDQNHIRYFFNEERESLRVYVCSHCNQYIKTIAERNLDTTESIDMATMDIATQYLDELAMGEGFLKTIWWMPARTADKAVNE